MNRDKIFISTDDRLLNTEWVVKQILGAYWGSWRTPLLVEQSMKNSMCFGMYYRDPATPDKVVQIGFARVVTDGTTFNWICDVIIEEKYRHSQLGSFLMETVLAHPDLASGVSLLGTRDAHTFYEKFGYKRVEQMKRIPPKT